MTTFIRFKDYELISSLQAEVTDVTLSVPGRDLATLKQFFSEKSIYPLGNIGLPHEFTLYDVDRENCVTNIVGYVHGDAVVSIDEYRKSQEPALAEYRKALTTFGERFANSMEESPFNLVKAFAAAIGPAKPVMNWYIQAIEDVLRKADIAGIHYLAVKDTEAADIPDMIGVNTVVFNEDLEIVFPPKNTGITPFPSRPVPYRPRTL
jgi:hypothetical protein